MEYMVEAYLWQQDIETLQSICNIPQGEIMEDAQALAGWILEYKLDLEEKKKQYGL